MFLCTSGGRHRAVCVPHPPPAPDNCAGAVVYLLADAMRQPADNYDCKFGCRVSWNPADIAGSGNPRAESNRAGRTAARKCGSDHTGKVPGYDPYIYRKYYRFMLRTASSIIRDSSLAEDAVHETFVQLLKEIDSLRIDNEKSLQSYLYILTRERTIDFLRKWERRRGVLTDYENRSTSFDNFKEPEEIALTNLQLNKAVSILSDMPSIYRRTLVLRVKGYSIREIAQITNSSESNVKTRIHRARAILLKSFDT